MHRDDGSLVPFHSQTGDGPAPLVYRYGREAACALSRAAAFFASRVRAFLL